MLLSFSNFTLLICDMLFVISHFFSAVSEDNGLLTCKGNYLLYQQ